MFCKKCGLKLEDNVTCCSSCGTIVKPPQAPPDQPIQPAPPVQPTPQPNEVFVEPSAPSPEQRGKRLDGSKVKKILLCTLIPLAVIAIVVVIFVFRGTSSDEEAGTASDLTDIISSYATDYEVVSSDNGAVVVTVTMPDFVGIIEIMYTADADAVFDKSTITATIKEYPDMEKEYLVTVTEESQTLIDAALIEAITMDFLIKSTENND